MYTIIEHYKKYNNKNIMSFESTITTIDIGSSKIRTIIGSFDKDNTDKFVILGMGVTNSTAIRKGNILDMEEFKTNLDTSLEEAEKMAGEQVSHVYLSFNSSSFEVITSRGVIAISGEEISQNDVDRVLDMAKGGVDFPNREVLKVIPESFSVDVEDGVKNPVGMSARKLEATAKIFSMNTNVLNNIRKAVSDVGIEVLDVYPNLLGSPEGVLTKRQKELGVVCVDIGASTTGITIYEEGSLKHSAVIPLGGDSVTNDIALGMRTSTIVAEKLKLDYAIAATPEKEVADKQLKLEKLGMGEEGEISLEYLSQIVTARYEEIFHFIREELKSIGKDGMLPEGAIFVGGGVKVTQFLDSAKHNLKLPCFIGTPILDDDISDGFINDPVSAAVIGTLILSNRYAIETGGGFSLNIGGFFKSFIKVFKKLLP
ncbi:cell division protein FtsA [Candidatus Gracilibacteria bacterium]|nr:cell division protein FtsA [Candidatus Gracilibacteria bacterium]